MRVQERRSDIILREVWRALLPALWMRAVLLSGVRGADRGEARAEMAQVVITAKLDSLERGLDVLDMIRSAGFVRPAALAATPGWNRPKAHRYLVVLERRGYITKAKAGGRVAYTLPERLHG